MNMRDIVNNDIYDTRITDIVNEDIYYIHKSEEIETNCYIEWEFINNTRGAYSANEHNSLEAMIQVDIFSTEERLDDYYKLEEIIQAVLEEKDYQYADEIELYEDDTKLWHKAFRYYKTIMK